MDLSKKFRKKPRSLRRIYKGSGPRDKGSGPRDTGSRPRNTIPEHSIGIYNFPEHIN